MIRNVSIRTKVIFAVISFNVVLFSLLQFQLGSKVHRYFEQSEQAKNTLLVETVMPVLALNLSFGLDNATKDYLEDIAAKNSNVLSIVLRGGDGRELFAYSNSAEPVREDAVAGDTLIRRSVTDEVTEETIGEVEFRFSNSYYEEMRSEHQAFTLRFFFITLILLALFITWLNQAFAPLKTLLEKIKRYDPQKNNFPFGLSHQQNEVGIIQDAIVDMTGRIKSYTSELDQLNEHLEQKVDERTDELLRTNDSLRREISERRSIEDELKRANEKLQQLSITDALTSIANRRHFNAHAKELWSLCQRQQLPLSLVICDIDFFKQVNDTYGHLAGDAVLVRIADVLRSALKRGTDVVARYGGEEFAILLFDQDRESAENIVSHIKEQLAVTTYPEPAEGVSGVTMSFGLCSHAPEKNDSLETLIRRADDALYEAKGAGRDRLVYMAYEENPPLH
jgi:diguanylate cyclase (GGDEF)-like protein